MLEVNGVNIFQTLIENEIRLKTLEFLLANVVPNIPQKLYEEMHAKAIDEVSKKYPGVIHRNP